MDVAEFDLQEMDKHKIVSYARIVPLEKIVDPYGLASLIITNR